MVTLDPAQRLRNHRLSVWVALVELAREGRIITYNGLAKKVGVRLTDVRQRTLLPALADHCEAQGLPPLTVLVVNKRTRQPGRGYGDGNLAADTFRVWNHPWSAVRIPNF